MSKKHIKLRAQLTHDKEHVIINTIQMTHTLAGFGTKEDGHDWSSLGYPTYSFVHGDVRIYNLVTGFHATSVYAADSRSERHLGINHWVFIGTKDSDPSRPIPLDMWKKIKSAVATYNEYFKE